MPADDQFRGLAELQTAAADLSRRLTAAARAGGDAFAGVDRSGTVEATVDADGRPVRARLDPDWRSAMSAAELGGAVVAATTGALTERLTAWAEGMRRQSPAPALRPDAPTDPLAGPPAGPPADPPADPLAGAEPGDPTSRQSQLAVRDMLDLLREADEQLPAAIERAESAADRPLSAFDSGRTVRVTATHGTLTTVDFDDEWLRGASPGRIGEAVTDAFAALARRAAQERADDAGRAPAIARLQRLTASPETLWRELGLIR